MSSKFAFLSEKWPRMAECGKNAEEYLQIEPGTSAAFLVHMLEHMVQAICEAENIRLEPHGDTSRCIKALWDAGVLPEDTHRRFRQLYRMRCEAVHGGDITPEEAASMLQVSHVCALWLSNKYADPGVSQPVEKTEAVTLEVTALPVLNYTMQQNGAVAVRSVTIHNNTDAPIENARLEITAVPAFAAPFTTHIDLLSPQKPVTLTRPGLKLDAGFLASTTEKLKGTLYLRLLTEEKELAVCELETTVLAFDQWQGLGHYPELLAAFVTPNHPQLATVIARATEFLGQWTGDTSMDGYQSQDPNRVLHQAGAIYSALRELSIAYAVPPASFEDFGQRVRLCDAVLQQKLGTCLDLTLVYASCLEAVGLHPLLISTPGHIFTGVWLEDHMFPESVQDDGSLITKRLAEGVNEIAVVETTALTSGRAASFDEARVAGEKNFTKQVDLIIDVRRARLSGVSPLPVRVQTAAGWSIHHAAPQRSAEAPQQLTETIHVDAAADEVQLPKKAQWERKLLDLGLRNTLINLRMTKTQLPILTDSLDALENALADGSDFTILPRPTDLHMGDFSFDALDAQNKSGIVQAEFENKRLRSILTEGELSKTIKELYRSARTALEENGANTLYLALGMLRWFETKRSTKARYAPVILLPIEMVRRSAAQGYVIRLRDDEPQMNITLLEKLKQDFGILVNGVDPLPTDEHGIDIRRVLTILRQAVMAQPHWDVLETACIGIFSFSQFVMWNDIRNRTEDLMRNKIVRSLIDGKLVWDAQPLEIGTHVDEDDVLLPMPADASQLYAIRAACSGQSFVLHGPPGTGKSQTITSLIANALAAGKRVLFVAEKMAALEVVQKRLDNIGIGPFCLELHSNRYKKRDVLEQLRLASEVTKTRPAASFAAKAEQLRQMRSELDGYARQLHRPLPCGSDLHTLIGEYEAFWDAADVAPFPRAFIQPLTAKALEQQVLVLEQLVAAGKEIGHPHAHPLQAVGCVHYTQSLRSTLSATVEAYITQLNTLAGYAQPLLEALGEAAPTDSAGVQRLVQIAVQMACWYDMPSAWAKTDFPQLYFDELRRMCEHYIRAKALEQQLMQRFRPQLLQQDGAQLLTRYNEVAAQWFLPRFFGINGLCKQLNLYKQGR